MRIEESDGRDKILFTDERDPYESTYIRARVRGRALSIIDSVCDHGLDGGWSHMTVSFDREETEKVFSFLMDQTYDPFRALSRMVDGELGLARFTRACDERGIRYESRLEF